MYEIYGYMQQLLTYLQTNYPQTDFSHEQHKIMQRLHDTYTQPQERASGSGHQPAADVRVPSSSSSRSSSKSSAGAAASAAEPAPEPASAARAVATDEPEETTHGFRFPRDKARFLHDVAQQWGPNVHYSKLLAELTTHCANPDTGALYTRDEIRALSKECRTQSYLSRLVQDSKKQYGLPVLYADLYDEDSGSD
jgi:hypothetical protein